MEDNAKIKLEKKNKTEQIHFRMKPHEVETLKALAAAAGMTISDYVRNVALGYQVTAKSDLEAIRQLLKAGADLGRLGGLLKKLITESPIGDLQPEEIRAVLKRIEANQMNMSNMIDNIIKF